MGIKYTNLVQNGTDYANRMRRLSNRIFGEIVRTTNATSMRVPKLFAAYPVEKNELIVQYYPRHVEMGILMKKLRFYGLFRDEHLDFKDEMDRLRRIRGKETEFKRKLREKQAKFLQDDLDKLQKIKI